jgi:hypothetical protein
MDDEKRLRITRARKFNLTIIIKRVKLPLAGDTHNATEFSVLSVLPHTCI